ncbi:hypothetical protein [Streptacidiphilus pinicola]|uniref:hypothetical protein n=1 Tax=Streptacidiphilus pinicola TaxID=2219663 RepID=UPI0010578845|nr:hypothetical protein [Streptacidiphilus pinicola]
MCVSTHKRCAEEVVGVLSEAGWTCKEDTTVTRAVLGPAERDLDSHWTVIVTLPGGPTLATTTAEEQVTERLKNLGPACSVRGAWLWEQQLVPSIGFCVYKPSVYTTGFLGWCARRWRSFGFADTGEVIHEHSEAEAQAEFERRAKLSDGPRRPEGAGLRRRWGTPSPSALPASFPQRVWRRVEDSDLARTVVFVCALMALVFVTRGQWEHPWWGPALLVPVCAAAALFYWVLFPRVFGRGAVSHSTRGLSLAVLMACLGVLGGALTALMAPSFFSWQMFAAALAVLAALNGLRLLTAAAWARKAALGLIPIALSLFPPLTQQISQLSYAMYLSPFSLQPGDAPVTLGWIGAWRPIAVGAVGVLIALAGAGYARYWNREPGALLLVPMCFLFLVGVLGVVAAGWDDGRKAQAAAAAGTLPGAWHGLTAKAVCLYPLSVSTPFAGAPPVTGRPVMSFDIDAAQVALWDPRTGDVTRLPGSSADLRVVPSLTARCSTAPR